MSVIIGVIHMSFGMSLQIFNHLHFGKKMYIFLEVVPQLVFFWSIFGYLVLLIIMKWLMFFPNPSTAPGLLNTLIYMFLSPGSVAMPLFRGQGFIQVILVLLALFSIPCMLFLKPYYALQEHKRTLGAGYSLATPPQSNDPEALEQQPVDIQSDSESAAHDDGHGGGGEFDFSDLMINQMIHTIEFTLSGISNTASYLRLWALSLAHARIHY